MVKLIENPIELFSKALILRLTIGKPGNEARIPDSKYQVDADKKRTKAQQKLLEAPEITEANKCIERLRQKIRGIAAAGGSKENPSPCGDGTYLLGIDAVARAESEIEATLKEMDEVHKPAIREKYDDRIAEAKVALNGLFNPDNYLEVDAFLAKYYVTTQYISFGAPEALAQVREDLLAREQSKSIQLAERTANNIPVGLAREMKALTDNLLAKTDGINAGDKKKFKGLLDNYLEFLNNLPIRNILGVEELTEVGAKAMNALKGVDSEDLRENKRIRDMVAREMSGIQTQLNDLIVSRPVRGFDVDAA